MLNSCWYSDCTYTRLFTLLSECKCLILVHISSNTLWTVVFFYFCNCSQQSKCLTQESILNSQCLDKQHNQTVVICGKSIDCTLLHLKQLYRPTFSISHISLFACRQLQASRETTHYATNFSQESATSIQETRNKDTSGFVILLQACVKTTDDTVDFYMQFANWSARDWRMVVNYLLTKSQQILSFSNKNDRMTGWPMVSLNDQQITKLMISADQDAIYLMFWPYRIHVACFLYFSTLPLSVWKV